MMEIQVSKIDDKHVQLKAIAETGTGRTLTLNSKPMDRALAISTLSTALQKLYDMED